MYFTCTNKQKFNPIEKVGRGGRDGEKTTAILLYSRKDIDSAIDIVAPSRSPEKFQVEEIQRVMDLQDFLVSKGECRNAVLRQYFGEEMKTCASLAGEFCDNCDEVADSTTIDVMMESGAVVEELRRRDFYEFNVLVDALKGLTRPDSLCNLVAIMRFWPTPEIERFIRFIARNGLVTLKPDYHKDTEAVFMRVKLGPKWNFDKNKFMPFPLSNKIKNDIDQGDKREPANNAEIQDAGRKFVCAPPVRSLERVSKSTRGLL